MNHEMTHLRVNLSKEWFISIDIIATDNQSVPVWIIFRSKNKIKKLTESGIHTPWPGMSVGQGFSQSDRIDTVSILIGNPLTSLTKASRS